MTEETLHRMKQMKFSGMANAFRASMEIDQTTSSVSKRSPMPSWIESFTLPIEWN